MGDVMTATRSECRKPGCHNERGITEAGLPSIHCDFHIAVAAAKIARLVTDHPMAGDFPPDPPPHRAQAPAFTPPAIRPEVHLCQECNDLGVTRPAEDCRAH